MEIIEKIFTAIAFFFVLILCYVFLVAIPLVLYTESECLKKGYPESAVTIGMERYCINKFESLVDKQ